MSQTFLALANLGTAFGCVLIALLVAPHIRTDLVRTGVGALLFFGGCGLLHVEIALHTAFDATGLSPADLVSLPMTLIIVGQMIGILLLAAGLYREIRELVSGPDKSDPDTNG